MIVQSELQRIYKNLSARFDAGFNAHPDIFSQQVQVETSTSAANLYMYLSSLPNVREWVGERVLHDLATRLISLPNKQFELSFKMPEKDIEDALGSSDAGGRLNAWAAVAAGYGEQYRIHRNKHYTDTLIAGLTDTWEVDGQFFYDTDHPVNPSNPGGSTFANSFTGTALTHANADSVYTSFRGINDEMGNPMVLGPIVAEVPIALETKAKQIWEEAMIIPSVAVGGNVASLLQPNPNKGRVAGIIVNPWLDAQSVTTRWFLHCVGRPVKPFIWQEREGVRVRPFTASNSEITAMDGMYRFLTDARYVCGRALPHLTVTAIA